MKTSLVILSSLILSLSTASTTLAETLGQRAVYTVKVLPAGDPAQVGQCSAFAFGDISDGGGGCLGGFSDNSVTTAPTLTGGDGINGDGLAGTLTIETDRVDPATGNNTFSITAFQMDPYLGTPGGTFKTTMTPPDGALPPAGSGTVTAAGAMTLDVTGRVGVAQFFEGTIGIQPWNLDNSAQPALAGLVTGLYEPFTTADNNNWDPGTGASNLTLSGRPIGDANSDLILDAVLVSVGNVGAAWGAFDGTPYSEAFNVQFELVSAKPVAVPDLIIAPPVDPIIISVANDPLAANDILINDLHADPSEAISLFSFTQPRVPTSSIVDNLDGTLTYTPDPTLFGADADSFEYTITDLAGETDTATVTINLATGLPPVCTNVITSTDEDVPLTLDPTVNCTDPDGDTLTIFTFDPVSVELGTVVLAGGNDLTYTPALNFFSPPDDSFGFTVTDGNGNVSDPPADVIITVNSVNDPLVCEDVSFITDPDTPLPIDVAKLLDTCTDAEDDTITLAGVQTPTDQGGNVSDDGAGTLTYTPPAGFSGEDTFTYTATDGIDTDTKTITVSVGKDFGNFTMLDSTGNVFGGTNDVIFERLNDSLNTSESDTNFNMTIASDTPWPFFSFIWTAHDIRVFGPGTYSFDTGCTVDELRATGCPAGSAANSGPPITMTVGPEQLGVHILFDWNEATNIDVVNVWNQDDVWNTYGDAPPKNELYTGLAGPAPDPTTTWALVSTDVNGDNVNGTPMVDGPFQGYYANFNASPGGTAPPPEPYTGTAIDTQLGDKLFVSPMNPWVLSAMFMTLFGLRRISK